MQNPRFKNNSQTNCDLTIHDIVERLCSPASYESVMHRSNHDMPMPSIEALNEVVEMLRGVLFPGYFGLSELKPETMRYYTGSTLDRVYRVLLEQITRGFCFMCKPDERPDCAGCESRFMPFIQQFMSSLPTIRHLLSADVKAAYVGDPAAQSPGETIFCYPSIRALANYRIAHELYKMKVPLIPRIITEMAHSLTGIDIHPGAQIGEFFFMDHGTGIVIGETTIIGKNVRIYQGVTLGAKSFPLDAQGSPVKGIPRHPIVEDEVVIYSGATILGRITIGRGSVIGGNLWITRDVPPGSKISQSTFQENGLPKDDECNKNVGN